MTLHLRSTAYVRLFSTFLGQRSCQTELLQVARYNSGVFRGKVRLKRDKAGDGVRSVQVRKCVNGCVGDLLHGVERQQAQGHMSGECGMGSVECQVLNHLDEKIRW